MTILKSIKKGEQEFQLRRYTSLSATIQFLQTKEMTFLNPYSWDDKNDVHYLYKYKDRKKAKTVLVICFANCKERYHHWRVFAAGTDGICIEFHKDKILGHLKSVPNVEVRRVKYKEIDELNSGSMKPFLKDLPFLKRAPYRDEQEIRAVYVNETEIFESKKVDVPLFTVSRITLSPWMPRELAESVRKSLKAIEGCQNLKIVRSTLIRNERWKRWAD